MKPLASQFKKDGFDFKLLLRDGRVALLRKTKPKLEFESHEVVLIQRHNGYEIGGVKIEPAESMPRSEKWGIQGWTFVDRESAELKFNALRQ